MNHTRRSRPPTLQALIDALDDDGGGTLSIDEIADFVERGTATFYNDEVGEGSSWGGVKIDKEKVPANGLNNHSPPPPLPCFARCIRRPRATRNSTRLDSTRSNPAVSGRSPWAHTLMQSRHARRITSLRRSPRR